MKWQETNVNKCHKYILLIILIFLLFIIDLHIFLYTDLNDAVKDFCRDYR